MRINRTFAVWYGVAVGAVTFFILYTLGVQYYASVVEGYVYHSDLFTTVADAFMVSPWWNLAAIAMVGMLLRYASYLLFQVLVIVPLLNTVFLTVAWTLAQGVILQSSPLAVMALIAALMLVLGLWAKWLNHVAAGVLTKASKLECPLDTRLNKLLK